MTIRNLKEIESSNKLNILSDVAHDAVINIIDNYTSDFDDQDAEVNFDDLYDLIWEECDGALIYYKEAWAYLMDVNFQGDFEDAIKYCDCKNITQIAVYYLDQEISDFFNEINN